MGEAVTSQVMTSEVMVMPKSKRKNEESAKFTGWSNMLRSMSKLYPIFCAQ